MYKIVLPPLPARDDEKFDFLKEVVHIVNHRAKDCVVARICGSDFDVRIKQCLLTPIDAMEEYGLFIYSNSTDTIPIWHEVLSSIGIATFSNGFWLELTAESQPSVVLYIP
jgi:hypothetical protein